MFGGDRIHSPNLMSNSLMPTGPYFDHSYNQDLEHQINEKLAEDLETNVPQINKKSR